MERFPIIYQLYLAYIVGTVDAQSAERQSIKSVSKQNDTL